MASLKVYDLAVVLQHTRNMTGDYRYRVPGDLIKRDACRVSDGSVGIGLVVGAYDWRVMVIFPDEFVDPRARDDVR